MPLIDILSYGCARPVSKQSRASGTLGVVFLHPCVVTPEPSRYRSVGLPAVFRSERGQRAKPAGSEVRTRDGIAAAAGMADYLRTAQTDDLDRFGRNGASA